MEVEQETAGIDLEMETTEGEETMSPFDAARVAYEAGHRDALSTAVQRVEALDRYYCEDQWHGAETHLATCEVIAAIKGENP